MVKQLIVKHKLEQLEFWEHVRRKDELESTVRTVPYVETADRESPSSELGPSSLYRGCYGRSGADLPVRVGWAELDEVSQVRWTAMNDDEELDASELRLWSDAVLDRPATRHGSRRI